MQIRMNGKIRVSVVHTTAPHCMYVAYKGIHMRWTACIIICIVLLHIIDIPHATASSEVSSGLEEHHLVLVDEGATPDLVDTQSRTLNQIIPATPFDAIIFNWIVVGDANDIQLRARYAQGTTWSEWELLVHNQEFAPENAPRGQYTSTLFALPTLHDAWQIDIIIAPDSQSYLKEIHTVTMNNQGANAQRAPMLSAATILPRGSKPPIVSRNTWGDATLANWDTNAAPWSGYCNSSSNKHTWLPDPAEIAPASHVIIHHTAGSNYADPSTNNWPASVLGIWRYHAMTLGWCDIGYHYLIDPNGVIYEGRYTGVRDDGNVIDGAHALGHNRATIGISLMGNFETVEPSAAALMALDNLLSWIGSSKNISFNTEQYYAYKNKTLNTIIGHRDVGSTSCPGNFLYAKLPQIRLRAAQNVTIQPDDKWIQAVSVDKTSLVAGDVVTLRMTIKNIYQSIPISGSAFSFGSADAGFTFTQQQCWALKDSSDQPRFPRPGNITSESNNRFRVIAGYSGWDRTYANTVTHCPVASTVDHPWRWSIGTNSLAPGAIRTITGRIRFTQPGTYAVYVGIIKDWVGYPDKPCDRTINQGACQLRPITIRVVRPTATYPPYAQTQVSISTATHARIQTQVALNKTQSVADRNRSTQEVLRGSPSRTRTRTNIINATPTPLAAIQTIYALQTATRDTLIGRTRTAQIVRTNQALAAQLTQTSMVNTQVADNLTATAETTTRTTTVTPSPTYTPSRTHTTTATATRTRTNQPTLPPTRVPPPVRLFDVSGIQSTALPVALNQLQSDNRRIWALSQTNPPMLYAFDLTTLAQLYRTTLQGTSATIVSINPQNPDELFVVGRYAWDLLAIQRLRIQSGTPIQTGVWLYKTMGTPSTLVSTGRYVYMTINHAAVGTKPAYAELITLSNASPFTEAFARQQLPGSITAMSNIDSGDFVLLIAGQYTNNTGYVVPVTAGQSINLSQAIALTKPLRSLSSHIQTTGLVPAMIIIGSDGTTWTRLQYTITNRQLRRITTLSNNTLTPQIVPGLPFSMVSITNNRLGFSLFSIIQNAFVYRAFGATNSISTAQITRFSLTSNQLYWHDGSNLYRIVITLP